MELLKEIQRHHQLEQDIAAIIKTLKEGGPSMLTKTIKMITTGHFDLTALGLPANLIETLEDYQQTSAYLRKVCYLMVQFEKAENEEQQEEKDDVNTPQH